MRLKCSVGKTLRGSLVRFFREFFRRDRSRGAPIVADPPRLRSWRGTRQRGMQTTLRNLSRGAGQVHAMGAQK